MNYYVLIQYCPDPGRDERVNVGVVTVCDELPGKIEVRVDDGAQRAVTLFPECDIKRVVSHAYSVARRMRCEHQCGMEYLEAYISGRMANDMQATMPRAYRGDLQTIDDLFRELMLPPQRKDGE